ncbi:MAG: hypothetical protein WDW38_009176 [Sanguina aurantia]
MAPVVASVSSAASASPAFAPLARPTVITAQQQQQQQQQQVVIQSAGPHNDQALPAALPMLAPSHEYQAPLAEAQLARWVDSSDANTRAWLWQKTQTRFAAVAVQEVAMTQVNECQRHHLLRLPATHYM